MNLEIHILEVTILKVQKVNLHESSISVFVDSDSDPDGLCHTSYQTLSDLVPDYVRPCTKHGPGLTWTADFVIPCTRHCHTLYQILSHLVPNTVTTCTQPCHPFIRLCHTLYQNLSHLVPNPVWATIGASRRPGEARPFCEYLL